MVAAGIDVALPVSRRVSRNGLLAVKLGFKVIGSFRCRVARRRSSCAWTVRVDRLLAAAHS
jgi:hypothetical protein